jgi:hypothetical protein
MTSFHFNSLRILFAPLSSALLLALFLLPAASATAQVNVPTHTVVKASTSGCSLTGWNGTNPTDCQATAADTETSGTLSASWVGGAGCNDYYTGSDHPWMVCRDTSITVNNFRVAIRHGYWNPDLSPPGFGWAKAYYYHNLWMQPMIDTIRMAANPYGSNSSRDYEVYHYNPDGYLDQRVIVVADITDVYFDGHYTQDGHAVGVLTGYCESGNGTFESECPDWVDSTL